MNVGKARARPSDTTSRDYTREWGDAGLVTCVLDQTYRMQGKEQRITAPTSMALRRVGDEWKIALFHSMPLPEAHEG